ncbi:MAG: hypothetical protein ACJ0UT_07110 [Candidatus Latescibacterota bacterium]
MVSDSSTCLEPVHLRHLAVHEHGVPSQRSTEILADDSRAHPLNNALDHSLAYQVVRITKETGVGRAGMGNSVRSADAMVFLA